MVKDRFTLSITVPFHHQSVKVVFRSLQRRRTELWHNPGVHVNVNISVWLHLINYRWTVTVRDGVTDGVSLFKGTAEQGAPHEICALLGYYAASGDNSLPTFRDNISVWPLNLGPIGCPETSVRNCQHRLRNIQKEFRVHQLRSWSLRTRKNGAIWLAKFYIAHKESYCGNSKGSNTLTFRIWHS